MPTPFVGSGRFVPKREWTCSQHSYPAQHECDCSHCDVGEWECPECASACWVEVRNPDGSPVMRELGAFEALMLEMPGPVFPPTSPFLEMLLPKEEPT